MEGLSVGIFVQVWITLILLSFGQILLKLGIGKDSVEAGPNPAGTVLNILKLMVRPKCLLGFSFYAVGTLFWLLVLSKIPLSVAFPLFSMSYFLVVILSATILRERVNWRFAITGLVLISIGVTFIGMSCPQKHREQKTGSREQGTEARPHPSPLLTGERVLSRAGFPNPARNTVPDFRIRLQLLGGDSEIATQKAGHSFRSVRCSYICSLRSVMKDESERTRHS